MSHSYVVELAVEDGGPEPALRERFTTVVTYRLEQLEEQSGFYPKAGGFFHFLDAFEGKFVCEMTDAELEATPPSSVDVEVLEVDPVEAPGSGEVEVRVRIPF